MPTRIQLRFRLGNSIILLHVDSAHRCLWREISVQLETRSNNRFTKLQHGDANASKIYVNLLSLLNNFQGFVATFWRILPDEIMTHHRRKTSRCVDLGCAWRCGCSAEHIPNSFRALVAKTMYYVHNLSTWYWRSLIDSQSQWFMKQWPSTENHPWRTIHGRRMYCSRSTSQQKMCLWPSWASSATGEKTWIQPVCGSRHSIDWTHSSPSPPPGFFQVKSSVSGKHANCLLNTFFQHKHVLIGWSFQMDLFRQQGFCFSSKPQGCTSRKEPVTELLASSISQLSALLRRLEEARLRVRPTVGSLLGNIAMPLPGRLGFWNHQISLKWVPNGTNMYQLHAIHGSLSLWFYVSWCVLVVLFKPSWFYFHKSQLPEEQRESTQEPNCCPSLQGPHLAVSGAFLIIFCF